MSRIDDLYNFYQREYTKEVYQGLRNATEIAKTKLNNQLLTLTAKGKAKALKELRIGKLDKQMDIILKDLRVSQASYIELIRTRMYYDAYNINRMNINSMIGEPIAFHVLPRDLIEDTIRDTLPYLDVGETLGKNLNVTKQRILNDLVSQLMTGEAYDETARSIAMHLNGNFDRARKIARTELHRVKELAVAKSNEEMNRKDFSRLDSKLYNEWKATADSRTREDHMYADGQRKLANGQDLFRVGQSKGVAPGNLFGIDSAAQNINCRCTIVSVVEGQDTENLYNPDEVAYKEYKKAEMKTKRDKKNYIKKVKEQQEKLGEKGRYMQEVTQEKRNEIADRLDTALKENVNASGTVRKRIKDAIQNLDYRAINILNENFDEITDRLNSIKTTKDSWYSPKDKTINLNFKYAKDYYGNDVEKTFFHELGHYLDDNIKIGKRDAAVTQKLAKELREEVMDEVNQSIIIYRKRMGMDTHFDFIDDPLDFKMKYSEVERYEIAKIMQEFLEDTTPTAGNIQDLWQGATQSAVRIGWGHDLDYYKYMGGKEVDELYAHFFQQTVLNDKVELLNYYFPNSYKLWKETFAGGIFK
ncbi:MAG: hypothetical protein PWQ45_109 [Thermosipho sp. (in: thermotogales)]|nr:hypothetical protein [Thermosipho sp. (in: thermotogales)]